jgi:hypothetical protein
MASTSFAHNQNVNKANFTNTDLIKINEKINFFLDSNVIPKTENVREALSITILGKYRILQKENPKKTLEEIIDQEFTKITNIETLNNWTNDYWNNLIYWTNKYLKYKQKYLTLKNNIK